MPGRERLTAAITSRSGKKNVTTRRPRDPTKADAESLRLLDALPTRRVRALCLRLLLCGDRLDLLIQREHILRDVPLSELAHQVGLSPELLTDRADSLTRRTWAARDRRRRDEADQQESDAIAGPTAAGKEAG